jgi:hypothetical protein
MAVLLGLGMDQKILLRRQFCHVTILQDYRHFLKAEKMVRLEVRQTNASLIGSADIEPK